MDVQTPHSGSGGYAFPILKPNIILQCANELGVELTSKELTEPHRHKDALRKVFTKFIEICLGISEDELDTIPTQILDQQSSINYCEMYDDAIFDLKYQRYCIKLMKLCGIHDFGLKDLHSPTTKRLQTQLSGIINLAKYREDRLMLYKELEEQRRELFCTLEASTQEQHALKEHVEKLRIETVENSKKVQELSSEQYEIELELSKKNKLQSSLRNESKILTKQADDLKYQIATISLSLQETEREENILKSEIVKSPEKIQVQLEQLKSNVEEEKNELYAIENDISNTKNKIENVDDAIYQIKKINSIVSDVISEVEKYKRVVEDVHNMQKSYQVLEDRLKDLREENFNNDKILEQHEDKYKHMKNQYLSRKKAVLQSLESARDEFSMVQTENQDGIARIEAAQVEVRNLESKIEEERIEYDNDIRKMKESFFAFANQVEILERQFLDKLNLDS